MASNKVGVEFWEEYAEKMRLAREEVERQEAEHEYELEIIETSRPAVASDFNAALFKTMGLLSLYGFWSAAQVTRTLQPGTIIKSGEKEGQVRPDREMTNVFIHAVHPDRRIVGTWHVDGALKTAQIGHAHGMTNVITKVSSLEDFITGGTNE